MKTNRANKATLPATDEGNRNGQHFPNQLAGGYIVVASTRKGIKEFVNVRIWHSASGGTYYATIWCYGKDGRYLSGSGRASGCGWDKGSTAIAAATRSAGITLDKQLSGRGANATKDACEAIARALGARKPQALAF